MASSVNNIAATFSTLPKTTSSSSSSSSNQNFSFSVSVPKRAISTTSWNPHAALPKSQRSSLVNFYGPPGPPPSLQPISTVRPSRRMMTTTLIDDHNKRQPRSNPVHVGKKVPHVGKKVPNVSLSFLNRNGVVQNVSLSSLCKGKRVAVVGVSAAFSPGCARFVRDVVELAKTKGSDLIACVAVNDVFVMKAWGENLAVGESSKVMMLSDGHGELAGAFGVALDTSDRGCVGLGVRSMRFCLNTLNGVITSVDFDEEK